MILCCAFQVYIELRYIGDSMKLLAKLGLRYGLGLAQFIDHLFYRDEASLAIVYGGYLGTGKSAYCIKATAEVYGSHSGHADNVPNYEAVKDYLVFTPKQFVNRVLRQSGRSKVLVWDDMGLWLFALDWYDPFVKATTKYLNVMRTDWAVILGNTPSPKMIVRKIHRFPQSIRIKVGKLKQDEQRTKRLRFAKAYKVWISPDLKKTGVTRRGMWVDEYDAMMPDKFFWDWYKPLRDSYAAIAKQMMLTELSKLEKAEREARVEDSYAKVLPEPERVKELREIVQARA